MSTLLPGGTNFAIASARAAGGDENIGLSAQVETFLSIHADTEGKIPRDTLYVIIIGANDVRDASIEMDDKLAEKTLQRAVDQIERNIRALVSAGAEIILVGNASDVGLLPETTIIALSSGDIDLVARATQLSKLFNEHLARRIDRYRNHIKDQRQEGKSPDIVLFDIFSFFNFIIKNHQPLGFTNTKQACYNSGVEPLGAFNVFCFSGSPPAPAFDEFIFFDWFHPTANVHKFVGQGLFSAIPLLAGDLP